jgi:hypothetical protein
MKRIIVVFILSVAMIISVSAVSFGEQKKDVTVFGVTLGKSLKDSGIPECSYTSHHLSFGSFKDYDYKSYDCYQESDISSTACFTKLNKDLSFPVTIYLMFQSDCDRQSPVQEIQVTFNSDNYSK